MAATPLPPQLALVPLTDPAIEAHGYPGDHPAVLWGYAPIVGPSATVLYLHLFALLDPAGEPVAVDTAQLLAGIGIAGSLSHNAIGAHTLTRMATYDLIRRHPHSNLVAVRRALPPLTEQRRNRLPDLSRRRYDHLASAAAADPLTAQPDPCPRCPHPLNAHSVALGCRLCACTHQRRP